jgi:hypothetical protein
MRTTVLLPLTALVAVLAGCGSEGREQAARAVPKRDLTLVTQTAQVEIASPVEIQRLRIQGRTAHPSQWAARLASASRSSRQPKIIFAAVTASTPTLAVPEPIAQPTSTASTSNNSRELLPGKTVTVIPASTGASAGSDTADELPPAKGRTKGARGGGTCRGRGRGPGIGMAPSSSPGFPLDQRLRLRAVPAPPPRLHAPGRSTG